MAYANNNNIKEDSVRILLDCFKGNNINNQFSSSISMVPSMLRDISPSSYNPLMVSIGPLHHKYEKLRAGQRLKTTYMRKLFERLDCPIEQTLEACVNRVNESIYIIRECYVGMGTYSNPELARMMVIDSCFILEFLSERNTSEGNTSDLLFEQLGRDLLLVENQIPFFVLQDIFELIILKFKPASSLINDYIYKILRFGNGMLFKSHIMIPDVLARANDHDHILGLLHKCYGNPDILPSKSGHSSMRNAVELEKAGVSFQPNQNASWIMDIKYEFVRFLPYSFFWVKPTLKMPILIIYDDTECFLRNIIAYEQTSEVVRYFTSYASAIDDLVDSHHDIAMFVESKVIINGLGSNEEAANMINSICKNVIVKNFYVKQWEELEAYYNSYWPRHIAYLRRTYFNNPWSFIALLAGLILFALTAVQTYFTINPRK